MCKEINIDKIKKEKKNERWPIRVLAAIIIIIIAGILIYFISFRGIISDIELKKDTIEAGTKVKDFTKLIKFNSSTPDIFKIEALNTDRINLRKTGKHKITYLVTRNDGHIKKEKVVLNVIDTKKPKIRNSNPTVYLGEQFDFVKILEITDNAEGDILSKVIEGGIDNNKLGDYKVTISVSDRSGNEKIKKVVVSVILSPAQYFEKIITGNGGWVFDNKALAYQFYTKNNKRICKVTSKNYTGLYEIKNITLSQDMQSYILNMKLISFDASKYETPPNDGKKFKIKFELHGDKAQRASIAEYINNSYREMQNVKKYNKKSLTKYFKQEGID